MIVPLRSDDLHRIWLVPETHFTVRLLRQHLERYPHLGWMVRESGDYIVGRLLEEPPGHRPDHGVQPVVAARPPWPSACCTAIGESGSELVVISEREVNARPAPLPGHGLRRARERRLLREARRTVAGQRRVA